MEDLLNGIGRPADGRGSVRSFGPIGIIGCGAVTRTTIRSLTNAGAEIAWLADPDSSARDAVLRELSQHQRTVPLATASVEDGLRRGASASAVMVNSPAALHLDHIEQCARAGRPMLVAKPLTVTFSDAERALGIAAERGVGVMLAEQYPYQAHAVHVRGLIEAQGPVRRIHFDHRKPLSSQSTLAGKQQTGIVEFAVHHYAVLASWLNDLPEAISADTWSSSRAENGEGALGHSWLRYPACHVSHAFGFGSPQPLYRLELETEAGEAVATGSHFCASDVSLRLLRGAGPAAPNDEQQSRTDAWVGLYSDWLGSSADETSPRQRRHMLIVMAMMDAAIRSAQDDVVVMVSENHRYRSVG